MDGAYEAQDTPRTGIGRTEGEEFDFERELKEFVRVRSILTNERSSVEEKVSPYFFELHEHTDE
jgi:hypothetical protein